MKRTTLLALSASVLALSAAHAEETSDIGKVTVTGVGNSTGSGYIIPEDATKSRSTVTKEGIENRPSSSNPYQHINILPGVRGLSQDATGLFGGAITMRGFNDQQLGFTIDGAPVNDSGDFSVYPQEYVDGENLEQIFVTQGSTDPDSPHVGATGGNIGIVSSNPVDFTRVRIQQSVGELEFAKTFVRFDTGNFDGFKAYVSYSDAQVDKFKGEGEADRKHVDTKLLYQTGGGSQYSASVVWNNAINNFFRNPNLAQWKADPDFDYLSIFPGRLSGAGSQDEFAGNRTNFYDLQINPFENAIVNLKANMQLSDNVRLDVEPYFWYGKGGGAFGTTVAESNPRSSSACAGSPGTNPYGQIDLNGDGDDDDCVLAYRNSTTETYRPGVNMKMSVNVDNWKLVFGGWYERARHRQRQPFTIVDANGQPLDQWSETHNMQVVVTATGELIDLQGRDRQTVSEGFQVFGNATGNFLDDALKLNLGLRAPTLRRDVTYLDYSKSNNVDGLVFTSRQKEDSDLLPSFGVSYALAPEHTLFVDGAKNMKAPQNFVVEEGNNSTGIGFGNDIEKETAWNFEAGYRYQSQTLNASLVGYYTEFQDRLLSTFDADIGANRTHNIGDVTVQGVEFEVGTAPWHGLTAYVSATYTNSELQDNLPVSVGGVLNYLPTVGKQMVETPEWMFAASLGYTVDDFFIGVTPKYMGKSYASLMNDQAADAFTVVDLTAGYRFPDASFLKGARLQLFANNLFDEKYLFSARSTTASATPQTTIEGNNFNPGTPTYNVGQGRFISASLSFDLY